MNEIPLFQGYDEKEVLVIPRQQIDNFIENHNAKLDSFGVNPYSCTLR